jgi:hypothetical protein
VGVSSKPQSQSQGAPPSKPHLSHAPWLSLSHYVLTSSELIAWLLSWFIFTICFLSLGQKRQRSQSLACPPAVTGSHVWLSLGWVRTLHIGCTKRALKRGEVATLNLRPLRKMTGNEETQRKDITECSGDRSYCVSRCQVSGTRYSKNDAGRVQVWEDR